MGYEVQSDYEEKNFLIRDKLPTIHTVLFIKFGILFEITDLCLRIQLILSRSSVWSST